MARTIGTNLTADIEGPVTSPRLLIEIVLDVGTLRYSSGESITYNSNAYSEADVLVSGLSFQNVTQQCSIVINDLSTLAQQTLLTANINDAATKVTVYATANVVRSTNDVVPLYVGLIDSFSLAGGVATVRCGDTPALFPNTFINEDGGFTDLEQPGNYVFPGGTLILRRDGMEG